MGGVGSTLSPGGSVGPVDQASTVCWACDWGPASLLSGDGPPGGAESQALAGEVGKVDHTSTGEQVGEVAL